jgi:hypothetical protein
MDPDCEQISLAKSIGADRIELYTGHYAEACLHGDVRSINTELQKHAVASSHASALGLGVNAGHDLNLDNLPALVNAPARPVGSVYWSCPHSRCALSRLGTYNYCLQKKRFLPDDNFRHYFLFPTSE